MSEVKINVKKECSGCCEEEGEQRNVCCEDLKEEQLNQDERQRDSETPKNDKLIQELTETLQHLQAEFENYKKRVSRDQEEYKLRAKKDVILQFLPIIDNFELAIKSFSGNKDDVFKGFELIYSQLMTMLENEGVKPIRETKFDPGLHEPLLQEKGEENGVILEVLQKGYYFGDKVLRTAKVKISKND